jgi:hypothetical protein
MMVYEKISCSRTRSCHYIESFILFIAFCPHIWGQNVVCIKGGSMLVGIYIHIPDMYPVTMAIVTL